MAQRTHAQLDHLRKAAAKRYASRAACSFQAAQEPPVLAERERRACYEQGWLDCAAVLLGALAPPDPASPQTDLPS